MNRHEARNLLCEYVLGQLDDHQVAAVAEHLAEDENLQTIGRFLRWLQPRLLEMESHLPGIHPSGDQLVNEALGHGGLQGQSGDWVQDHLAKCAECAKLVKTIKEANAELIENDRVKPIPIARPQRSWIRLAVAASFALVIFTAGMWIGTQNNGPDLAPQVVAVHLTGITRDSQATTKLIIPQDNLLPPLVLECDPWIGRATAETFQLGVIMREQISNRVVQKWQLDATVDWSVSDGGFVIVPQVRNLTPGVYDIEIKDDSGKLIFKTGFHLDPR